MNLEQIKEQFTMREILDRCNIHVDRNGFCQCCFHKGDNTPSMKIYEKGYYCFGCGEGGDFIDFVRKFHGLPFKDACEWISGEELSKSNRRQMALFKIRREKAARHKQELKEELLNVSKDIADYWQKYKTSEPLSDEWTNSYNTWQILCYKQDCIMEDLGAL